MQFFWAYLIMLFIASYSLSTHALGNMSFRVAFLLSLAATRSVTVTREDLVANTSIFRNLFKSFGKYSLSERAQPDLISVLIVHAWHLGND